VLRLRKQLDEQGLDAGANTIGWHLAHHHDTTLSRATIHRILARHGALVPEPAKRPRSSYIRFEAAQPNQCWQPDSTHYRLAGGHHVEIITWLDDHSCYALHVSAHRRITARIVADTFSWSTTCTSASSTPPPANYSATSRSTPHTTTSPDTRSPETFKRPNPHTVGSGVRDVLRHHLVGVAGFEPTAPRSQSECATKLRHTPCRAAAETSRHPVTSRPRSGLARRAGVAQW
jgi:hypothetical protein